MTQIETTKAPRRRLLPREERRAAIVHSAAEAFAREGYSATSMETVAAASGVTKLILYRNFESKEALYRSVLETVSKRLAEVFVAELRAARRPAGARALLTVAREEPHGFVLLWRHATREAAFADYVVSIREMAIRVTRELIARRIDDHTMLAWAAETLVAWNVDAVLAWLEHGDPDRDDEFVEQAAKTVAAMIGSWSTR